MHKNAIGLRRPGKHKLTNSVNCLATAPPHCYGTLPRRQIAWPSGVTVVDSSSAPGALAHASATSSSLSTPGRPQLIVVATNNGRTLSAAGALSTKAPSAAAPFLMPALPAHVHSGHALKKPTRGRAKLFRPASTSSAAEATKSLSLGGNTRPGQPRPEFNELRPGLEVPQFIEVTV